MNIPEQALDAAAGAISQMISGFLRRHEPLSAGQAATAALQAALPAIEAALRTQIAADIRATSFFFAEADTPGNAAFAALLRAARIAEKGTTK